MKKLSLLLFFFMLSIATISAYTEWFNQDDDYSLGEYEVTVISVNKDETMCGIKVNGIITWINEGHSKELGNLYIKVLEAIAVKTLDQDKDTCQLIIYTKNGDSLKQESKEESEETSEELNETVTIESEENVTIENEETEPVVKESFFQRLINSIKSFLKRILNKT